MNTTEDTITVYLDSVDKWRNKGEYTTYHRASLTYQGHYMEKVSQGNTIVPLLRQFHAIYPQFTGLVAVQRGETPVFPSRPIKQWFFPRGQATGMA